MNASAKQQTPGLAADSERPGVTAGAILRSARLARDKDLREVAAALCIRLPYLQAIEDGKIEDMPGVTYGIGFVRAYADYLKLDAEDVVNRFKGEAVGINRRTELQFPEPLPGNRVPGGALLFILLLLAGGVYGGWLYASSQNMTFTEAVEAVPKRLQALIKADPAGDSETATAMASEQAALPPPKPAAEIAPESPPVAAAGVGAPAVNASGPETAPETAPGPALEAIFESASESAASPAPGPAPDAAVGTVVPETAKPASGPALEAMPNTAPAEIEAPAPGVQTAARPEMDDSAPTILSEDLPPPNPPGKSEIAAANEPRAPPEKGAPAAGTKARIIIEATSESWVQIVAPGGDVLVEKLMLTGEIYRVPDRGDLVLNTGNAGALKLIVNGKVVPPLGNAGAVMRGIKLSAAVLLP